jgi:hypothetical protein
MSQNNIISKTSDKTTNKQNNQKNSDTPQLFSKCVVNRLVYLLLLLIIMYCSLHDVTRAIDSQVTIQTLPPYYLASGCTPLTFRDISSDLWNCIKSRLQQEGFKVPSSDNGELSGNGATADFSWDKNEQTLAITVKSKSFFYSCESVNDEITNFVDACRNFEEVHLVRSDANGAVWRIDAPNVKQREAIYKQVSFRRGDTVTVSAGGCVQHGGHGKTWTLYLNPQAQHPRPYFYGLIKIPGMPSLMPIRDFLANNQGYVVPNNASGDMFLHLGFEDFRYEDNGYWGHKNDNGYNDQCKGVGNAWVQIEINHARR